MPPRRCDFSMKLRTVLVGALVVALISSLSFAAAQSTSLQGSFVKYSIQATSPKHQIQGTLQKQVLQDYGDGRVKVRLSGNFTDTRFSIERNVTANRVHFPVLPSLDGFSFSVSRKNVSVSITAKLVGTEDVVFQGGSHKVNVTSFSAEVSYYNGTTTSMVKIQGTVRTFHSGLLYHFEASKESPTATFAASLLATNLDLDSPSTTTNLSALIRSIMTGEEGSVQSPNSVKPASTGAEFPVLILLTVVAIVSAVVLVVLFRSRRLGSRQQPETVSERPPHWVQQSG